MNTPNIRGIVQQEIQAYMSGARFGLNNTNRHTHNGIDSPAVNSGDLIPGLRTSGSVEFDSVKSYKFNTNFRPSLVTFYGNPFHTLNGNIIAVTINSGGTGYHLGDILHIDGGTGGTARVVQLGTGNSVLDITLVNAGNGYSSGVATTTSTSGGTGATVNVTSNGIPSIDVHTFVFGQAALGQNLYFQPDTTASVTVGGTKGIVQTSTMLLTTGSSFQTISSQTHLINVQESGSVVARATVSDYGSNSFTITVDTLATGWTILGNYFVT